MNETVSFPVNLWTPYPGRQELYSRGPARNPWRKNPPKAATQLRQPQKGRKTHSLPTSGSIWSQARTRPQARIPPSAGTGREPKKSSAIKFFWQQLGHAHGYSLSPQWQVWYTFHTIVMHFSCKILQDFHLFFSSRTTRFSSNFWICTFRTTLYWIHTFHTTLFDLYIENNLCWIYAF